MSTTLSYGFVKPTTGETGAVFFPILEDNIQKTNDHNHNGTNSARLTAIAMAAVTQAISSASWSHQGAGTYRQTVSIPASLQAVGGTYDDYNIQMRDSSSGNILYLTIEKVSSTSYYVYINDNSISLTAVYT